MKAMSRTFLPALAGIALLISAVGGASAQGLSAKLIGTYHFDLLGFSNF
jgi:hypothetical protein